MTTRYCIDGATYNGDGTSSAEAASAGGVGAYNDVLACMRNDANYTVSAGDICIVKSSPAGTGGGNRVVPISTTVGVQAGSDLTPAGMRVFLIDDGTTWAQTGDLIFQHSVDTNITMNNFTAIVAPGWNCRVESTHNTTTEREYMVLNGCYLEGIIFDIGKYAVSTTLHRLTSIGTTRFTMKNIRFNFYAENFTTGIAHFDVDETVADIENLVLDFSNLGTRTKQMTVFDGNSAENTSIINIDGLTVIGESSDDRLRGHVNSLIVNVLNFKGQDIHFCSSKSRSAADEDVTVRTTVQGNAGGDFSFYDEDEASTRCWESTDNYPTTSLATLEDGSNTPWSIRIFPDYVSMMDSRPLFKTMKRWNSAADQVKAKVELAIHENFSSINNANWYVTMMYIDNATGDLKIETTKPDLRATPTALTASTLAWSSTSSPSGGPVYGAENYDRYKIEITSANSVKSGEDITVMLHCEERASLANEFFFVCPDPVLTAV